MPIETRYDAIDWLSLAADVQTKLTYLRAAWQTSEKTCEPALHLKMVEDIYLPTLRLLAEFCACFDTRDDEARAPINPPKEGTLQ